MTRCIKHLYFAETRESEAGRAFFDRLTRQLSLASTQSAENVERMRKTPDEWRTTGVKYAVWGEADRDPTNWLTKARHCFVQCEDETLLAKVDLHLESIAFRNFGFAEQDGEALDNFVASLLLRLLQNGLKLEARRAYEHALPLLDEYARENLEKRLSPLLPLLKDYV